MHNSPIALISHQNGNSIGRNANFASRKVPGIVGEMTGLCHYGHNMIEGSEVLEEGWNYSRILIGHKMLGMTVTIQK